MNDDQSNPPRIAQALLAALVRPRDTESIAGDLLEEYRVVRRPSLGAFGANAWYAGQVLSVLWRLVWPLALTLIAARSILVAAQSFPLSGHWNPSLVPAPNVSLLDGALFVAAGYYGARRTGRLATGIVNAGALALIDFALFAGFVAWMFPSVLAAMAEKPFIFIIGCAFLSIAIAFAVSLGAVGAAIGRSRAVTFAR